MGGTPVDWSKTNIGMSQLSMMFSTTQPKLNPFATDDNGEAFGPITGFNLFDADTWGDKLNYEFAFPPETVRAGAPTYATVRDKARYSALYNTLLPMAFIDVDTHLTDSTGIPSGPWGLDTNSSKGYQIPHLVDTLQPVKADEIECDLSTKMSNSIALVTPDSDTIDTLVDIYEAETADRYAAQVSQFATEMAGINAVGSSAYVFGMARLAGDRARDLDKRRADIMENQRARSVEILARMVDVQAKVNSFNATADSDYKQSKISNLTNAAKWNLNILKEGSDLIGSLVQPNTKAITPGWATVLSGTLNGIASGAQAGAPLGQQGMLIGGGLGGLIGGIGGISQG